MEDAKEAEEAKPRRRRQRRRRRPKRRLARERRLNDRAAVVTKYIKDHQHELEQHKELSALEDKLGAKMEALDEKQMGEMKKLDEQMNELKKLEDKIDDLKRLFLAATPQALPTFNQRPPSSQADSDVVAPLPTASAVKGVVAANRMAPKQPSKQGSGSKFPRKQSPRKQSPGKASKQASFP